MVQNEIWYVPIEDHKPKFTLMTIQVFIVYRKDFRRVICAESVESRRGISPLRSLKQFSTMSLLIWEIVYILKSDHLSGINLNSLPELNK